MQLTFTALSFTMFLYWRKRGAYELETLPSCLTQRGVERYSWSSPLDVIHDVNGKVGSTFPKYPNSLVTNHELSSLIHFHLRWYLLKL